VGLQPFSELLNRHTAGLVMAFDTARGEALSRPRGVGRGLATQIEAPVIVITVNPAILAQTNFSWSIEAFAMRSE
jgi:hypothetical protein